jgi:hypothetical protein
MKKEKPETIRSNYLHRRAVAYLHSRRHPLVRPTLARGSRQPVQNVQCVFHHGG